MATENPFVKLFAIDFKDHLEVKKSGNTELKYVSWAYAWAEVKKLYPAASYEVKKFNGLPYVYDPITGFMVYTSVTIEGVSHEMWLPVLDGANKAMKAVPYTYTTPKWEYNQQTRRREKVGMEERTVEAASLFFPKPLRFSFYDVSYRSVPAHPALRYTHGQVLWYRHQDCSFVRLSGQLERYITNACQNNRRHTDIERTEYHR